MSRGLSRFANVLKKSMDTLLAPAEDPRQTFARPQDRQQDLLARVQKALAENVAFRQQLQARVAQLRANLSGFEAQAQRALRAQQEDLARLALQRRQMALMEAQALEVQAREAEAEEHRLALVEQKLTTQIEALRARQAVVAARYTAAEAQVQMHEAFHHLSDDLSDVGATLDEAEHKAEAMQARAAALDQLAGGGELVSLGDEVERQLTQLDLAESVEKHLAALKRQMQ